MKWHKSSHSTNGGECVEVAEGPRILVRDTQHREQGHLTFDPNEWAGLLNTLRRCRRTRNRMADKAFRESARRK